MLYFPFLLCWLVCFSDIFVRVINVQTFNAVACDKASHNVAYKSIVVFLFTAYLNERIGIV